MLSIGWPELMVVAAAALIIVGPRDLPALLRNIGQVTGRVRRMSNEFRAEINKVAALDDVKDIRKSITAPLNETRSDIESEFNKIGKDGVSPSGKLTPTDPEVESVYERIKQQTGEFKPLDAKDDPIKAAIEQSRAPVADVKPAETATKAKTTRSRKAQAKSPATKKPATKKPPANKSAAAAAKPAAKSAAKPRAATASKAAAKKPAATKKPAASKPRAPRKQPASKA